MEIVYTRKVKDNKELEPPRVRTVYKQSRELGSVTWKDYRALLLASLFLSYCRRALSSHLLSEDPRDSKDSSARALDIWRHFEVHEAASFE